MDQTRYWIWLSCRSGLRPGAVRRLLERTRSPEEIFRASEGALKDLGLRRKLPDQSLSALDAAEEILKACEKNRILPLCWDAPGYPERLRQIPDPPAVLFCAGNMPDVDSEAVIAVVGTRHCSEDGFGTARRLGAELAAQGAVLATGLARGIDTAAAVGALEAGGTVLGVLGCGTNVVYPPENRDLYSLVSRGGALVSEYPPGTEPLPARFPERNRIISGLSLGVVVVECPARSGAGITARVALEQNRDVYAVPGNPAAASCAGSNALLQEGAAPVLRGSDVTREYAALFPDRLDPEAPARKLMTVELPAHSGRTARPAVEKSASAPKPVAPELPALELDGDEAAVLSVLRDEPMGTDEIIEASGLSAPRVLAALTMLEMESAAAASGLRQYIRTATVK